MTAEAKTSIGESRWTRDQLAAIEDRGHDLIVGAAAGSGKTAVLTERVLRLIGEAGPQGEAPPDLTQLLVITFTRKAAREMRERIETAILKGLSEKPHDAALRAALDALPRAHILTIHSFCERLVRRHFARAGVSPGAAVVDDEEEREIEGQATRAAFEEWAGGAGQEARDFADLVSGLDVRSGEGRAFGALADRLSRIRNFLSSLEDPEDWQEHVRENFERARTAQNLDDLPDAGISARALRLSMRDLAESFERLCDDAVRIAPGSREIVQQWRGVAAEIRRFSEKESSFSSQMAELHEWLAEPRIASLEKLQNKGVCGPELFGEKIFAERRLKRFAASWSAWKSEWFALSPEAWIEASRLAADQGLALLRLASALETRIQEIKKRRGALGFGDLERRALMVLRSESGEGPSDIADEYQRFFRHVLVDEYQDVSPLQEALIGLLSHARDPSPGAERNLFVVGDLKQSIYRFRRADPTLFAIRLRESPIDPPAGENRRRISLRTNFRSRPGVLECVNLMFERLMDETLGDIPYDEEARLHPHRVDPEGADKLCVEAHWIESQPEKTGGEEAVESGTEPEEGTAPPVAEADEAQTSIEREAGWIARRILELTNKETGLRIPDSAAPEGTRVARSSDCAILVRNFTSSADAWIAALARYGLRARASGHEALSATPEASDLLAALRVTDNPFQDVPLASFLRSPMAEFTEDDLLRLRMALRSGPFHEAVWAASNEEHQGNLPDSLREKLARFRTMLDRWRELAVRGTAEEVFAAILVDTGYEAHVLGLPAAEARFQRIEELRRLLRARAARGGASLAEFLRSLDGETRGGGEDEAEAAQDDEGTVHLMTIHKSKGLEFPIVFLARVFSRFGGAFSRDDLELNPREGMALAAVDPIRRLRMETPGLVALRYQDRLGARAEEFRLLYVAMTRARERLILTGVTRLESLDDRLEASTAAFEGSLPVLERLSIMAPGDLIAPMLDRIKREQNPDWLTIETHGSLPARPEPVKLLTIAEALQQDENPDPAKWTAARESFVEVFSTDDRCESACEAVAEALATNATAAPPPLLFPASHRPGLGRVQSKITASGLSSMAKRTNDSDFEGEPWEADAFAEERIRETSREQLPPAPAFIAGERGGEKRGAERGQLVHLFFQHVDLRGDLAEPGLREQAETLLTRGLLGEVEESAIQKLPMNKIASFFVSPLGRRMAARPGSVTRELLFRRWITVRDFFEKTGQSAPGLTEDELSRPMLVQGMIDCVIDEGGKAVLIDYKTDFVRDAEDLRRLGEHYFPQIDAYRQALRTIWRVPVAETYLAFIDAGVNELVVDPYE